MQSLEKQMASMSKGSGTPVKLEIAKASTSESAVSAAAAGAAGFGAGWLLAFILDCLF